MQKVKFCMEYQKYNRRWGAKFVHHLVKSTVATILKNKAAIKGADVVMDVKQKLKQSAAVEEMEKLLL